MLFLALAGMAANAQTGPSNFSFNLEPITVNGLPGLQSFAVGEIDGKYLIVGGRTDGLHRRQPFAAFDVAGKNGSIWLLDPATGQVWSKSLTGLPASVVEQLASTNMQFWQDGATLFCIGGYGYAPSANDHITFPFLTAIDLAGAAQAIQSGNPLSGHIRQSAADERLRVTGGYLGKLGSEFYLAGGQKFMGRYNPMGPTHGPGFVQVYSDEIRRFNITDNGTTVGISNYSAWHDSLNLHRRDYNMVPQVFPDGRRGFTMFSGVFQHVEDLPWLNTVDFDSTGLTVNNQFS